MGKKITFFIKGLSFIYLVVFLVLLFSGVCIIFFDADIIGVESNVIYTIQGILESNHLLYTSPETVPFAITQYSPLYYILCDFFLSLFHINPANQYLVRIGSRLVAISAFISTLFLIFYYSKTILKNGRKTSFLLASLFLVFTFPWSFSSRPDVFITLFIILFVLSINKYIETGKTFYCVLLGFFSVLSILSKQNGIVLPFTGVLFLLLQRDFSGILKLAISSAVSLCLFVLIFYLAGYDFKFVVLNIVDGVKNGVGINWAIERAYLPFFSTFWMVLLIPAFLYTGVLNRIAKPYSRLQQYILLGLFVFLGHALLSSLKIGSAINYYNEFLLFFLLFWAYVLQRAGSIVNMAIFRKVILVVFIGSAVQIGVQNIFIYTLAVSKNAFYSLKNTNSDVLITADFLRKNTSGSYYYSFFREIGLALPKNVVLYDKDIHGLAFRYKVYDYQNVRAAFAEGKVKYVVGNESLPTLLGIELKDNYVLVKKIGIYHIYEFKHLYSK